MDSLRRAVGSCAGTATICALGLLTAPFASADQASCSYDSGSHVVSVALTPGKRIATTAYANFAGQISAGSYGDGMQSPIPCPGASVTNTDTIVVNNSSATKPLNSIFYIGEYISNSGNSPGFTNEPGSSDEIEFQINFGPGGRLGIQNSPGQPVNIALGGKKINLNRYEADGIDPDVTVTGSVLRTLIYRSGGSDHITAAGGFGTPAHSYGFPIESPGGPDFNALGDDFVIGSNFADILTGTNGSDLISGRAGKDAISGDVGADTLFGGAGKDRIAGGAGKDVIFGNGAGDNLLGGTAKDKLSGGSGKDKVFGGLGNDSLFGNQGIDRLDGQGGNLDKCKGPPDHLKHCEIVLN